MLKCNPFSSSDISPVPSTDSVHVAGGIITSLIIQYSCTNTVNEILPRVGRGGGA